MAYTKPVIVAQNSASGSYAAGCPTSEHSSTYGGCRDCEITQ